MTASHFLEQLNTHKPLWQHGRFALHTDPISFVAEWRLGGWQLGLQLWLGGEFGDEATLVIALPGVVVSLGIDGLVPLSEEVRENGRCYGLGSAS